LDQGVFTHSGMETPANFFTIHYVFLSILIRYNRKMRID
jgi:hypothetical protein